MDLVVTLKSFNGGSRFLDPNLIANTSACKATKGDWSCSFTSPISSNSTVWMGSISDIGNIISVSLQVYLNSSQYVTSTQSLSSANIRYDVSLYACLNPGGCGVSVDNFVSSVAAFDQYSWNLVLNMPDQVQSLNVAQNTNGDYTVEIFGNTFQNQEAIPVNSQIKSYLTYLTYDITTDDHLWIDRYEHVLITRPKTPVWNVLLPFILFITCVIFAMYCYALYNHYRNFKWLAEQKWILCYFFALILFQNPIYCVIVFIESPSPEAVFAAYILDSAAQASFFTIWLLFADGLQRKKRYFVFYLSKIVYGCMIMGTECVVLTLQFPTLNPYQNRSPVEAVYNWSDDTQKTFIAFSMSFLLLLWLWTLWWFYTIWNSFRALQKLPYMTTRYLQLSFRYFFLQATLVAVYYIAQYFIVIYLILANTPPSTHSSLESISDNINTLFRQQSQLYGKVIFLTTYALILAFLFLPASFNDNEAVAALATSFVVNEDELDDMRQTRRNSLLKLNNIQGLTNIVKFKIDVFCVDRALNLLEVAYEAYYDVGDNKTDSGYGPMDIERHDYSLIDYKYDSEHETFCIILRHKTLARVVVAFRGTSNRKHWNDNLNYKKKLLDLEKMTLGELDKADGSEEFMDDIFLKYQRGSESSRPSQSMYEYAEEGAKNVKSTIVNASIIVANTVIDATSTVVGTTTNLVVNYTPGLKTVVLPHVHSGFWEAYTVVREFMHEALRRELTRNPAHVCFTGHSLGGALTTIAALDFKIHSLSRINAYLLQRKSNASPVDPRQACEHLRHLTNINISMYNFGSPRVGNRAFAEYFDKHVPNGFRVVVDGDIVSSVPYSNAGFKHVGTEALIDPFGAGSIIIDSSFIERRLRNQSKASVSVHMLSVYKKGLLGVKGAWLKMKDILSNTGRESSLDGIVLALNSAPLLTRVSIANSPAEKSDLSELVVVEDESVPDDNNISVVLNELMSSAVSLKWKVGEKKKSRQVSSILSEDEKFAVDRRFYDVKGAIDVEEKNSN